MNKILAFIIVILAAWLLIEKCSYSRPDLIPPSVIIDNTDSVTKVFQVKIDSVAKQNSVLQDRLSNQREKIKKIFIEVPLVERVIDTINCKDCEAEVTQLKESLSMAETAVNENFITTDSVIAGKETIIDLQRQKYDSLRRGFDIISKEYKECYEFARAKVKKPKRGLWFAAGVVVGVGGGYYLKSKIK